MSLLSRKVGVPTRAIQGLRCSPRVSVSSVVGLRRVATYAKAPKDVPPPAPEVEVVPEGEYDDMDEGDPLADLTASEKRRVLALRELQAEYDKDQVNYLRQMAKLQAEFMERYTPLFESRKAVISGQKPVEQYGIADDGAKDEGIPQFWVNALANHPKIGIEITDRDGEALEYLEDIRCEYLVEEERGFKIIFYFRENPFFTNKELVKTYVFEADDVMVPKVFSGSSIDWKQNKNLTVELKKKRKGGKKSKEYVTEEVPCESFFNLFSPPQVPEDPSTLTDEDLDDLQDTLNRDFDVGIAIKDAVLTHAVEWFTGEAADAYDDGEYEEDEEGEEY